jgi:hypothetical protein
MTIQKAKLVVDKNKVGFLTKACQQNRDNLSIGKGEVIFDESVAFPDGKVMDIQVVASLENEPCWTQGVLYEKGTDDFSNRPGCWGDCLNEVGCTDCGESLLGEYHVLHDNTEYICEVICHADED